MLREKAIRVRIERLLAGQGMANDVDLVFADIRFLPGCPPEVKDIAHFAAHRHEREKGIAFTANNHLLTSLAAYLTGNSLSWSANPRYSDTGVVSHFQGFLVSSRIFAANELANFSVLTPLIARYALTSMHGCRLEISGGSGSPLAIRGGSQGFLEIGCTSPMPTRPDLFVDLCVFTTTLGLDIVQGRLRSGLPPSDPDETVERTPDGHLRYLE